MQLTETVKLKLNKFEEQQLLTSMQLYIDTVNDIVSLALSGTDISKYSSKDVNCDLPSAIRDQIRRDAKSIVAKYRKDCHKAVLQNRVIKCKKQLDKYKNLKYKTQHVPVVHNPVMYVNNKNFKICDNKSVEIPMFLNGKSKRIAFKTYMTDKQYETLVNAYHLGTLRIVMKNNKLYVQIAYDVPDTIAKHVGNVMGIDLGIKCPAVSYTDNGKVKFYGNGRKNKYLRRLYAYQRNKLLKQKKMKVVNRINNKENRVMNDIDHKISSEIIKTAVANNVTAIKMERLANIRSTTRTSRKNNHSLHSWSFYRLQAYIEYKANLAGIKVLYVNPSYTSQRCPKCGMLQHADDRHYKCNCGYKQHRDLVGAINICVSTEFVGNRQTA